MNYYFRHFLIFTLVGLCSIILAKIKLGISFGLPGIIYFFIGPICYWHGKNTESKNKGSNFKLLPLQ